MNCRVVIADDEPLARERLRTLLHDRPEFQIAAECGDGAATIAAIVEYEPALVFLDIRMPGLDGFEVASALATLKQPPAIIFVTAFSEHAVRAFDVGAVDYLMKPFDAARFEQAVARAARQLGRAGGQADAIAAYLDTLPRKHRFPERFVVRAARHIYFVAAADVEWVDASANYVRLHVAGRSHLVRDTMTGFVRRLDPDCFVRVHRSAIVRIDQIAKLEPYERGEYLITLCDGTRLTSSRAYVEGVRGLLK